MNVPYTGPERRKDPHDHRYCSMHDDTRHKLSYHAGMWKVLLGFITIMTTFGAWMGIVVTDQRELTGRFIARTEAVMEINREQIVLMTQRIDSHAQWLKSIDGRLMYLEYRDGQMIIPKDGQNNSNQGEVR